MNQTTALHELNLQKSDCPDEIRRAYRKLVRQWHPDQFAHQPEIHSLAEEKLKRINQAYSVLAEYFKNRTATYKNNSKFSERRSKNEKRNKPDPTGFGLLKGWLRNLFASHTPNAGGFQKAGTTVNPTAPFSRTNRSGFDAVLKKAYHASERQSLGARRSSRAGLHRYRRSSTSTRIDGFRSPSPAAPVQPIAGIDPIDGSD